MKAMVEVEFEGCLHGCPYLSDASMGPNYCMKCEPHRLVVGYSKKTSQIPVGKKHPDWCPAKYTA